MGSLAHWLRSGVDLLIWPFEGLGPFVTLVAISLITAVAILYVVRWTTPARWIVRARSQIAAAIYEVRLFLDSPVRVILAQGRLLGYSAVYILALMPALIVMSLPMGLIYLQLDNRYGFEPVAVGEPVVLEVRVSGGTGDVGVDTGDRAELTAPPVRDPAGGAVYFRLVVREPGSLSVSVTAGGDSATKRIVAEPDQAASPVRTRGWAMWWVPTDEPPLSGDRIQSIEIDQRGSSVDVLRMPWWLFWLILATVLALVLRKPFRVTL